MPREDSSTGEASRRDLTGWVIEDKYGVKAVIGEGGMGAVYEAEHLQIGRLVAVKVLHPKEGQKQEAVSRMEHEARVAGRIGHPNICEVYDMGRLPDGNPYLVMERLHGETLAQKIRRNGTVPPHEVVDIMLQVLSALVTAHERGIIHRDLKPENIFLSERAGMLPVAKLLDFGISKASGVGDPAFDQTQPGMVMGTPYYMAPEQARGERQLDHRVDLWAAGVILYESLTGHRPFVAKNYNALLVQILTVWHRPAIERNPAIPQKLSRMIDRALAKAREGRFQSAGEFLETLLLFKKRSAPPPPPPRSVPRVQVHTIDEDTSEDGTIVFARVHEDQAIVVASGARQHSGDIPDSALRRVEDRVGDPTPPPADFLPNPPASRGTCEKEPEAGVIDPQALSEDSVTMVRSDPVDPRLGRGVIAVSEDSVTMVRSDPRSRGDRGG